MDRLDETLLVCPTFNPGQQFPRWLTAYDMQVSKPAESNIIDSSSSDGALANASAYGFSITTIQQKDFNHGGTRQAAIDASPGYRYVIFLTQDAILASPASLAALIACFEDDSVAAVCGRQLPRQCAGPIEAHARIFNYGSKSRTVSMADAKNIGLKVAFLSNSFAAYRLSALAEVGGFPSDVIFGEDMYVAARLLKAGYKITYAAEAVVFHSHAYTLQQEFRRYFDMGVLHARESWIMNELGSAEGEGLRFVKSELKYLSQHAFWRIPEALLRTVLKYLGFRLGLMEEHIPNRLKTRLAMNKVYFKMD
jgi:rhamnosyltransferase